MSRVAQLHSSGYNNSVRLDLRVATPPQKPVLIYDGDCNFCRKWVERWNKSTSDRVEYLAYQSDEVGMRFPELSPARFETAVHLVMADGTVYYGAEAAFRALGQSRPPPLFLEWYEQWPLFQRISERAYSLVARHRQFFSFCTRMAWGDRVEPSTYYVVRETFLRGLAIIYLIAFLSLWVQAMGLIGSNGVLPASMTMFGVRQEVAHSHIGLQRYTMMPTLCWFSASDGFIKFQCAIGTILACVLLLGIAPAPCLFLLWLIYLSLSEISREFYYFQWDNLLLETGFLSIFLAPLRWIPRAPAIAYPYPALVIWLFRWLLFRLMLGSGLVKLLSGDLTWRNLTALKFHYETQPLPTWVGWYAHHLPAPFHKVSAFLMFVIELVFPLLIFAPRRLRWVPFFGFVLLQVFIFLTGNYCFFNLLSMLLCLMLLDDRSLIGLVPNSLRMKMGVLAGRFRSGMQAQETICATENSPPVKPRMKWPIQVTVPLTCIAVIIPMMECISRQVARMSNSPRRAAQSVPWGRPLKTLFNWVTPFRSFNTYGLFEVMTTKRMEIIIQGSNDGVTWLDYEFKYKPGNLNRRPGFVEPYQPRLDWQLWFAALSNYEQNPWFVELCIRLLNNSTEVLRLLENNPFPGTPPRYLRALVYEYHFTDLATRRKTGAWWQRELKGAYLPILSRSNAQTR